MTVGQLINKLKKIDPKLDVGFRDHDSDEYTISSWVNGITVLDFEEIPEERLSENIWDCKGKIAVLHS